MENALCGSCDKAARKLERDCPICGAIWAYDDKGEKVTENSSDMFGVGDWRAQAKKRREYFRSRWDYD